ncbi:MAG: alpha/beta hydrolase [Proteobacteria bacterium]|nr:MAG: alpha/beta hydrolase [Pseudomonadota bacterium]
MGQTFTLKSGDLKFTAVEQGEGPLVLCLHGFPDCYHSFRHQLPFLAEHGYRAVSVSLRGYEPSSQPSNDDYSLESIANDIIAFIDQLGAGKAHLIGHDWGAAITYTAGAAAPERFHSLTTMAVPHSGRFVNEAFFKPKQALLSWYMLFFQLRGIADHTVKRNDFAFIRWLWRVWSPSWQIEENVLSEVIDTLRQPGVQRGALAYYREALSPKQLPLTPARRASNAYPVPVPTLALTGRDDGCIDCDIFQSLCREADFPSGLEVRVVEDAGHFLHQEQPHSVNELILDWLQRHH